MLPFIVDYFRIGYSVFLTHMLGNLSFTWKNVLWRDTRGSTRVNAYFDFALLAFGGVNNIDWPKLFYAAHLVRGGVGSPNWMAGLDDWVALRNH